MRKYILFDIDNTLINTLEVKEYFLTKISNITGRHKQEILTIERLYKSSLQKNSDFNVRKFLKLFNIDFKSFDFEGLYEKSLFKDVINTLNKLKDKAVLGVFSEGYKSIQVIKLKGSKIISYFDKKYLFISKNKMSIDFINLLPKDSVIVDDSKEVIKNLLNIKDLRPIYINRSRSKIENNYETISSLDQLTKILNI